MDLEVERFKGELKQLRELNEKFRTIVAHGKPEYTGKFFICGQTGELDADQLPKQILVCPHYGLDGFAIYTKTSDYSAPSY